MQTLNPLVFHVGSMRRTRRKRKPAGGKKKPPIGFQIPRTVSYTILTRRSVPRTPGVALVIPHNDPRIAAFYASPEWRYLRYDTIAFYGAKCQCCNRTPEQHGIVLHVDHIVPLRKDWSRRLDRTNTQVLCEECNQGKGSRHIDDWRPKKANPFP